MGEEVSMVCVCGGGSACITMHVHIYMSGYDSSTFWIFLGQCHLKHLILPHKGN